MVKHNIFKITYEYFSKQIKKIDQFGEPVIFTVNGDTTFKTLYGGICTILFVFVIMTFTINRFLIFIRKQDAVIKINRGFEDLIRDANTHYVGK